MGTKYLSLTLPQTLQSPQIDMPPFWRSFPALWFYQVETEFRRQQIFNESTMKFYIMKSLKPNILAEVEENISSSLDELPYYLLKQALQSISKLPPSVRHVPYLAPIIKSLSKGPSFHETPLRPPPASFFPKPRNLSSREPSPGNVVTNKNNFEFKKPSFGPANNSKSMQNRSNVSPIQNKPFPSNNIISTKQLPAKRPLESESIEENVRTISPREQQNAFVKLLKYLLELLKKKDKERFFKQPVTARIAPDYFDVIHDPMDFFSMEKKVKEDKYRNVMEFHSDANLICSNAMTYNHRLSIFYLKAKELQDYIDNVFDTDNITMLAKENSYIKDIPKERLGFEVDSVVEKKNLKKEEKDVDDDLSDYEKLRAKNIAARMKMFEEMKKSAVAAVESIKPPQKRVKKEIFREEDFLIPKREKSTRSIKAIDYKEPGQRNWH